MPADSTLWLSADLRLVKRRCGPYLGDGRKPRRCRPQLQGGRPERSSRLWKPRRWPPSRWRPSTDPGRPTPIGAPDRSVAPSSDKSYTSRRRAVGRAASRRLHAWHQSGHDFDVTPTPPIDLATTGPNDPLAGVLGFDDGHSDGDEDDSLLWEKERSRKVPTHLATPPSSPPWSNSHQPSSTSSDFLDRRWTRCLRGADLMGHDMDQRRR